LIIFLYPVITKVPKTVNALEGRQKVMALSRVARQSAMASAAKSDFHVKTFEKDGQGIPVPSRGIFWSVSHKPDFVAGVVSTAGIGIDLEKVKDVSDALFERIVSPDEAACFNDPDKSIVFFRVFTAKEAVLKKTTLGMRGLSKVRVKKVIDDKNILVLCLDKKYLVENFYFDGYLASVTKDHFDVQWTLE